MNTTGPNDLSGVLSSEEETLKGKIQELETQLKILRTSLDSRSGIPHYVGEQKWKALIFAVPLFILSLIPPLLVVLDRWFKIDAVTNYQRETWCKVDFLCRTGTPGYYIWVVICFLLALILMAVFYKYFQGEIKPVFQKKDVQIDTPPQEQKQYRRRLLIFAFAALALDVGIGIGMKRTPGAELLIIVLVFAAAIWLGENKLETQPARWLQQWKDKLPLYGTVIFSQVALVLFMREIVTIQSFQWIYAVLLLMAAVPVIWQRKKLGKLYWVFTLVIILFTARSYSWEFSKIGDEYSAYYYPTQFIAKQSIFQVIDIFFSQKAVYEKMSFFSSFLQYITMALLGFDYFGWHISNVLLVALTLPVYFHFLKSFISERVAFITVVFLSFSHYLMNFSHIGSPNLDSLFPMALALWTAGRALKKRDTSAYFWVGIAMGSCFYFFPTALYALPLPLFLIVIFEPPSRSWSVWKHYLFILLGLVVMMTPLFFQPYYWANMLDGTAVATPSFYANIDAFLFKIGSNLLYSFFDYLFLVQESHFITASHLDPLTAVFVFPGLVLACLNLRRNRFLLFLLVSYAFEVFIVSTSQYEIPSNTRLFMLLPLLAVWAAIGLDWLVKVLAGLAERPGRVYVYVAAAVLVLAGGLNLVQANIIYPLRVEGFDPDVVIMRMLQNDEKTVVENPADMKNYLFLTNKDRDLTWYNMFQDVYHVPQSRAQMSRLVTEAPVIPDYWMNRIKTDDSLVVVVPYYDLSKEIVAGLQPLLAQSGRTACEISDKVGRPVYFQLWVVERYKNVCAEAQLSPY